ncbi:hypothetical protein LSCM1_06708 [Leishmania martiniquensis]|uniref:Dpy-30 motif containing protein n=1 Tax=Leishmania martiniquensis TaxID=1580590 RepID=A0A836GFI1_9TRYP|nr:hypothetical protein LSCM1_06708 [Leishmania martiniquensis]
MFSSSSMDTSVEAVDEETMHALLMHLGDVPSGAETAATTQEAATTTARLEATFPSAFLPGTTFGRAAIGGKDGAGADDEVPEYALPDAQYIERTMLPLLLRGLEEVAHVRPPDPLAFLGAYMICNNPQKPATEKSSSTSAGRPGKGIPSPAGASVDDTASPALAEAVKEAMSRFSTSKGNCSAASKPTATA